MGRVIPDSEDRPCLLVVDDQPANVQALYQALRSDYRILVATSAEQALALIRTTRPDLVLLDIVMPGMDGFEVCRCIKSDPSTASIPVIFVTSDTDEDIEAQGLDLGAVDFITKPIRPAVVRARVRTHLTLQAQAALLRTLAHVDGLTGVSNRRAFDERLAIEWRRAVREEKPIGLVMVDIDAFKPYNDAYGHQAGDVCLRRVAQSSAATLGRPGDMLARYGGEEFVCILPDTGFDGTKQVADRLEQAVRDLKIEHLTAPAYSFLTISLGATSMRPSTQDDMASLVRVADVQLYRAKLAGGGRVCMDAGH